MDLNYRCLDPLKTDLKKEGFHQLQLLFSCLLQTRTKDFL